MQARPNPFLDDIFVGDLSIPALGGGFYESTIEELNGGALASLLTHVDQTVDGGGGTMMLLSSVRAGAGKSQLLARLVAARSDRCLFVPLEVNRDVAPSWQNLLQGVLGVGAQRRKATPKVAYLDALCRRLMAEGAAELILRGDVPSPDPAAAIAMLKRDYLGAFDMRGGGSVVARWMVGNFHALLPLMGQVLGNRAGVDAGEAVAWLQVLARFSAGNLKEQQAAVASVTGADDAAGAKQRLISFCRLAALDRPLVLVFDHVDALAGSDEEAFELTCLIAELGRLRSGAGVVLSVNADVWGARFDGHLPQALVDRLTGREVRLQGIAVGGAEALVRLRLEESGVSVADQDTFLREARLPDQLRDGGVARDVLRHAAQTWERLMSPPGSYQHPVAVAGESVKDFVEDELPGGESLAEESTLNPPAAAASQLKKMGDISALLRELKSRSEQFVPQAGVVTSTPLLSEAPADDAADLSDNPSPLVQRFAEIRESLLQKPTQQLDLEALRRMVSLAGDRFPMVEASEFKMSPGEEPTVAKWVFPGNEILFGFEPEHQFRYWQSLIKLAGRRSESNPSGRLKLVVFSESDRPFTGAASIEASELQSARGKYLDVVDLAPGMIASITAADRVVCEMAKADEPMLPADAIRELAPQLDPLWRRITRPLLVGGESEMSA